MEKIINWEKSFESVSDDCKKKWEEVKNKLTNPLRTDYTNEIIEMAFKIGYSHAEKELMDFLEINLND
jgi:hypothetical protein